MRTTVSAATELAEKVIELARAEAVDMSVLMMGLRMAVKVAIWRQCEGAPHLAAGFLEQEQRLAAFVESMILVKDPTAGTDNKLIARELVPARGGKPS